MKLMTLNINYYMTKHGTWPRRKELIARSIQKHAPDVLLLQAVKQDPRTGNGLDQAAQLIVEVPDFPYYYYQPAVTYEDESQDGSAIVSRFPIQAVDHLPLTLLPGLEDPNQRVLLTALLEGPSGPLRVFNAHFSWVREQAALNLDEAVPFMRAFPEPAFLAGDFNTPPDSDLLDLLRQEGWTDTWLRFNPDNAGYTFEAPEPSLRIDYIWASAAVEAALRGIEIVSQEGDEKTRLSDHFGLLAEANL
jgi:endonuclease/exonuclease/phosphatase family metal-dependent hydrolase